MGTRTTEFRTVSALGEGWGTYVQGSDGRTHSVVHYHDIEHALQVMPLWMHANVHLTRDHKPLMIVWLGGVHAVTHG